MQDMAKWIERRFRYAPPPDEFPMIVERLRGTTVRLEGKVRTTPAEHLTSRTGDAWSIQEHIGHILDLEPLWSGRVDELLSGAKMLRAADMTNRKTWDANHNQRDIEEILTEFATARESMTRRLDSLRIDQVVASARHPRLDQPMRLVDLCWFVAEHDDHHLTRITRLQRTFVTRTNE